LQCIFEPHNAAFGFVKNKSIVQNAEKHVGSYYVYNIDLRNFFDSIDQARVWKCLQLDPFNLKFSLSDLFIDNNDIRIKPFIVPKLGKVSKSNLISKTNLAGIIANLCCVEKEVERLINNKLTLVKRNVLPQGAPTSPIITNVVCQRLDYLLTGLAKRQGLKYSRYADDITFSSMHNVYQPNSEFLKELNRIISDQGFQINENKTRLQKNGYKKEVTGLLVNEKTNVQQRYIKQLRMWIYFWERYGYKKAYSYFLKQHISDKGHIKKGIPEMSNIIGGKLNYLKMVRGEDNELYLKLKARFDQLSGKIAPAKTKEIEMLSIGNNSSKIMSLGISVKPKLNSPKKNKINITELKSEVKSIPVLHQAKELERLLRNFTANNHPLKYSCHSWEDGKVDGYFESYTDFLKKFDEFGRPICFDIQRIKKNLGTKILHFLNTPNENGKYLKKNVPTEYYWGENRMKFGWKSKELSIWAKENPDKDPFDYPIPNKLIINRWGQDIEISKFGDIVGLFKSEIEIRPEKSDLYNLFVEMRRKYLSRDFKVNVGETLKGKQFYTDVHDFKRALNKIFRQISERTIHPNITINAKNYPENEYTIVEILHVESICTEKTSIEMKKEVFNGDFSDILGYLENLCDWSVESTFADGNYRINYLSSTKTEIAILPIEKAEGFKHVFKFHKS
jgi:hypothetical protein